MTITSSTGLMSGLDIESIVTQLMAIESRSKQQLQTRSDELTTKQDILRQIQTAVKALQVTAANFTKQSVFKQKAATSSQENLLKVSSSQFANPGTYSVRVAQVASRHQLLSTGYSSATSSVGTGTLSIELGAGQLLKETELSMINAGQGIVRGSIQLTDGDGHSAKIDLTQALTMQDVVDAVNAAEGLNITAKVSGDRLVLSDSSAGTGTIKVDEVSKGSTAASLGLTGSAAVLSPDGKTLQGADLMKLSNQTLLQSLNDGNGIRGLGSGLEDIKFTLRDGSSFGVDLKKTLFQTIGDDTKSTRLAALNSGAGVRSGTFRITDRNGKYVDIDLEDLGASATLAQLQTHIQTQAKAKGMDIAVSFNNLDHIEIVDNSTGISGQDRKSNLIIEDLNGGRAADDLGIAANTASSKITGTAVWSLETLGDVASAINHHWNNDGMIEVSIHTAGTGLQVSDYSALSGALKIEAVNGSYALEDLGLAGYSDDGSGTIVGHRLISGLNTVFLRSLNGGNGGAEDRVNRITSGGSLTLTDRAGTSTGMLTFDVNASVQDMMDAINGSGTNLQARLNDTGNGIVIEDSTLAGDRTGNLVIAGDLADKLNLTTDSDAASVNSGNLQLQYISEATRLSDMRQGQGIRKGTIEITGSNGNKVTVNLANDSVKTLGDVIGLINQRLGITGVAARINDHGDGLLVEDTSGRTGQIQVADTNGYSARDLGIFGLSQAGKNYIDGSYEYTLDVGGGDSLEEMASKINAAGIGVKASLVYDGSSGNGYRLSLTGELSGTAGRVYFDGGTTSLAMQTLSKGQNAIMFYGDSSSGSPLLITSSSNTISNAIKGVTIDLLQAGDETVTINVEEDLDTIVGSITTFVDAYNSVMQMIAEVDYYDSATQTKGVLYGDPTIRNLQQLLQRMPQYYVSGTGFNRLSEIGIKYTTLATETGTDSSGKTKTYAVAGTPQLTFDETTFRAMYGADPDGVVDLFTQQTSGIGEYVNSTLEKFAGSTDSTMARYLSSLTSKQTMYNDRIEYMTTLLASKETRLYNQFYAMESALASMQSQQSALTSLSNMVSSLKS